MSTPLLSLESIRLAYDEAKPVVRDVSLTLERGQVGCLLGASGSGKSTVLRAIAGFEPLRAGRIVLGGRVLSGPGVHLEPEQRGVGMMFQDYALFPHLTVAANVGFGLRRRAREERDRIVADELARVGLAAEAGRYPHELSGGQQQRVALARALAPAPELLLLDEPFSNLDVDLRERLAREVRDVLRATGRTALWVTHHRAEAEAVGDWLGVVVGGALAQPSPT